MNEEDKEIECLKNAERYCCHRAMMSWTESQREAWRKKADWNRERYLALEEKRK